MKTIITHRRPHLDDLCAVWLLRSYAPGHDDAALEFIATTPQGGDVRDDPDTVSVGIGRGKFDEHKGDVGQSAATLVFAELEATGAIPMRDREALKRLVEWVRLEDTGRLSITPFREYSPQVLLQAIFDQTGGNSAKVALFSFVILDAALASAKNLAHLEHDWLDRVSFLSRFGPSVGYSTSAREADAFAYGQGFDLVAFVNKEGTHHNIRGKAGTAIDLTPVYEELKRREPDAWWYLHHSKKLVICGGDIAPDAVVSKLTLADLVELLKTM